MAKKILVVDDEPDLLAVLSFRLEKSGYEIYQATDGQETLDMVLQIVPDLIILDVYLPIINGDEVAKQIKKDGKLKNIPVILISASTVALEERAKKCQADGFFAKPIEISNLIEKIKQLIG